MQPQSEVLEVKMLLYDFFFFCGGHSSAHGKREGRTVWRPVTWETSDREGQKGTENRSSAGGDKKV